MLLQHFVSFHFISFHSPNVVPPHLFINLHVYLYVLYVCNIYVYMCVFTYAYMGFAIPGLTGRYRHFICFLCFHLCDINMLESIHIYLAFSEINCSFVSFQLSVINMCLDLVFLVPFFFSHLLRKIIFPVCKLLLSESLWWLDCMLHKYIVKIKMQICNLAYMSRRCCNSKKFSWTHALTFLVLNSSYDQENYSAVYLIPTGCSWYEWPFPEI